LQNRIEYQGQARSSDAYGCNYLSELRRVLFQYGRPQTRNYLEWGAGNTTLAIATMRHQLGLERLDTIDDNADYLAAIREQVPPWPGFEAHAADLIGPKLSDRDPELNYATLPLSWGRQFDFIYIDGRRRMECAMVASPFGHPGTVVILHDYRRARYQSVRLLFDIVEDGPQFRVMRPADIVLTRAEAQNVAAHVTFDPRARSETSQLRS
jgi:hypothetical protein